MMDVIAYTFLCIVKTYCYVWDVGRVEYSILYSGFHRLTFVSVMEKEMFIPP